MAQINFESILQKVAITPKAKAAALEAATEKVDELKAQMLQDFDNHIVTQEIEEGPEANNISETLEGLSPDHGGNLFSFIGFHKSDKPLEKIREVLYELTKIKTNNANSISSKFTRFAKGGGVEFAFDVQYPDIQEFAKDTPYPDQWSAGSWILDLEKGIQGLSYYIYDPEFEKYEQSRSTTALEAKDPNGNLIVIRDNDTSTPIRYLSEILENFKKNLK